MNAVVPFKPQTATVYSGQQLDLIRRTVAKDCNPAEFDLFVTVAKRTGLDPFRKQIIALVFNKDKADKRQMSILTGIDGLRAIAARSSRYRPDEDEAQIEYDPDLKSDTNPLGIVKAVVRIYIADAQRDGGWKPVAGVAYWDEFAPIKDEWAYSEEKGKRAPTGKQTLDGNWPRMPRVMIAKCAESQALRKAFPEDLSGLYEYAELDRAQALDTLPSEVLTDYDTQQRLDKIGAANGIILQFFPNTPLESVALGKVADRVLEAIAEFSSPRQMEWFKSANLQPMREFWARCPSDALEVKKRIEGREAELNEVAEAAERGDAA